MAVISVFSSCKFVLIEYLSSLALCQEQTPIANKEITILVRIFSVTLVRHHRSLFAIFNVNLTPEESPRKQTSSHNEPARNKKLFNPSSLFFIPFSPLSLRPPLAKWQFFKDAAKCFLIQFLNKNSPWPRRGS